MEACKTILEAMTCALEAEERRLKPRSEKNPQLWPWTVRGGYYEDWIRYLLVRELSDRFPEWEMQTEAQVGEVPQADLLICGHASVELKGPHKVREGFHKGAEPYDAILRDFGKQKCRAKEEPNLEHFVLLILHACKGTFYSGFYQEWLGQLKCDVKDNSPGICIRLQPSKPLVLNGDPWLLEVCLYRVF